MPNEKDLSNEETYVVNDLSDDNDADADADLDGDIETVVLSEGSPTKKTKASEETNSDSRKRKRKSSCKKEYSDEALTAAMNDIQAGKTLLETATKHGIPRSTLYMRVKTLGLTLAPARSDYTNEDMRQAIDQVIGTLIISLISEKLAL